MNESNNSSAQPFLTPKEIRRYEAQIGIPLIGEIGQVKIKQSKVLVVGSGTKGSAILQQLTTLGIGKLGICDNSSVQENELSSQILFGNSDLSKQKAITAKQKLQEINHLVLFELHNVLLNHQNIDQICKNYDIIVDATDNFDAHYLINDSAIRLNKPVAFACIIGSSSFVSVFNYLGGPSLRCHFPQAPLSTEEIEKPKFLCKVALSGIVACYITNEVIKIVLGIESNLNGNLLVFNFDNYNTSLEKINRNSENFIY